MCNTIETKLYLRFIQKSLDIKPSKGYFCDSEKKKIGNYTEKLVFWILCIILSLVLTHSISFMMIMWLKIMMNFFFSVLSIFNML